MSQKSEIQSLKCRRGSERRGASVNSPSFTTASVLFTTLFLVAILGLTLASFLLWVGSQNVLVTESHAWNAALANAEAGVEEAMAQINISYGNVLSPTNYYPSATVNWGPLTAGVFGPRSNTMISGSYSAIIQPTNPGPTITATGYDRVPYTSQPIQRTVQVTTTIVPVFANGVSTEHGVTLKGSGVTIDSYDSSDLLHFTNGLYNSTYRMAGGDVASLLGPVNIQNASLYGHLRLGPTASYSLGNGTVGDLNWSTPGGIEPGWLSTTYNQTYADVVAPDTAGWFTSYTTNPGNQTNTYLLTTGSYFVNGDLTINNNETMNISGNVTLYISGNINMKNNTGSIINILPGGSLSLFVGTTSGAAVSANLGSINVTGNANNFRYYGLPSNTTLTWNGNATFMGEIYAPEAVFTCGGGGNNNYDYQGACVVDTLNMNGHFNFHFDENLKRNGPMTGFQVSSWREL